MRKLTSRLSTRRRSPLAGLAVLLFGLLMTGGVYAVISPAEATTETVDQALVDQGKELFLIGCASCHGTNGEGIVTERGSQFGPSLVGVGAAAVDFQVGTGRMPMSQPGAQAPKKRVLYSDEEILALAAFVASLGPGPEIPGPDQYDPAGIPEEEREAAIVRGGAFFRTNCTACHNFAASGGALPGGKHAPSLVGVQPRHVYEAMLVGPQQMPVFSDGVLTSEEKRDIIAYLETIQDSPRYGGFNLGSFGPVSEGLFAWLVGIGGAVGFAIWIAAHGTRSTKKQKGAKA